MSSGPQDHQLRGSGDPTIFLVVLTTNVTTLVNLEPIFFTPAICFHIVNFVKPQKGMTGESSRMMIDLNVNNS